MLIAPNSPITLDNNVLLTTAFLFLVAFASYKSYSIIIKVLRLKQLMDEPSLRSVHSNNTSVFIPTIPQRSFQQYPKFAANRFKEEKCSVVLNFYDETIVDIDYDIHEHNYVAFAGSISLEK